MFVGRVKGCDGVGVGFSIWGTVFNAELFGMAGSCRVGAAIDARGRSDATWAVL